MIAQISHDLLQLVTDAYGNYAVSQIVDKWDPSIVKPIFDQLQNKIVELSMQKFSSNVIERCLERADP